MKKLLLIFLPLILFAGCGRKKTKKVIVDEQNISHKQNNSSHHQRHKEDYL